MEKTLNGIIITGVTTQSTNSTSIYSRIHNQQYIKVFIDMDPSIET